jgi:hypothetical protein
LFPLMTDLHRIRAHHLHDQYSQLVLTFWTYLVHTSMPHLMWGFHSANLYVTWILHGGIQPTTHQKHLFIFIMHTHICGHTCLCVCTVHLVPVH